MPIETILAFSLALLVAAAIPGPGVLALVGRALGSGFWPAVPMGLGMVCGDLTLLSAAIFGLAALAQQLGGLFMVVKLLGAAYLIYMGWRLWQAPAGGDAVVAVKAAGFWRMYLAGLTITLGNPKTLAFYLALLPTVIDLAAVTALGFVELCVIVVAILSAVLLVYAAAAARARALIVDGRAVRLLNRGSGTILIGAGAAVAAS